MGALARPQPLKEVLEEVERVLREANIAYEFDNNFSFVCELQQISAPSIIFEIEVCKMQRMKLLALKLKRIRGSFWAYKRMCSRLVAALQL